MNYLLVQNYLVINYDCKQKNKYHKINNTSKNNLNLSREVYCYIGLDRFVI